MADDPVRCCVVGGGPAGVMLGLLLARAGVDVVVLEKHKDFFRDFRGDTIHPATLQLMDELGLLGAFLKLPHQQVDQLSGVFGGRQLPLADFKHLRTRCRFVALMPQWDFLNFLASEAGRYPNFHLLLQHDVTSLIESEDVPRRTLGARATTPDGPVEVRAQLTVGCDGRHAVSRVAAHLQPIERGAPIDVLWFRLSRQVGDPENALGYLDFGTMLILINRGDYFQCGYIIAKHSFPTHIQTAGLEALRSALVRLAPFLSGRAAELTSFDQVKLLSVQVNRLSRWHLPGLLCIGDAAHAMSPVGGVGINLAVQDAVAAARILAAPLTAFQRRGTPITEMSLAAVQHRRAFPTRVTQAVQITVHRFLQRFLGSHREFRPPLVLRVLTRFEVVRRALARVVGLGVRPEHIHLP